MPMFFKTHGIVITIFALFHSLLATTKLSVVPQTSITASNATGRSLDYIDDSLPAPNTTVTSLTDKMHNRRRSKYYTDSSREYNIPDYSYNLQQQQQAASNPWPNYNWQQQPQAYNPWPEYNYHDYHQVTSLPDLTTIVYPRLTTPQPLRHSYSALRPQVTKLYAKPYPPSVHYPDFEDEPEEQLPFSPWYSGYGLYRWPSVQLTPVTYHSSGHNLGDDRISSIEHYHAAIGHHAPIIYHHHREESKSKFNMKHIGIAALVKLGLLKLKIFAILKLVFLILLKFKLLLLLMFIKFLLFLKALKYLKALLIPLLLLLLGLLLLPLLLLPLLLPGLAMRLLPLLLLSPLQGASRKRQHKADNYLMEYLRSQQSDPLAEVMVQLMEAETCVERIACQLATRKQSRLWYPFIKWYLNKITKILKHGRFVSYVEAYIKSSEAYEDHKNWDNIDGRQWCQQKYTCANSNSPIKKNDPQNTLNTTATIDLITKSAIDSTMTSAIDSTTTSAIDSTTTSAIDSTKYIKINHQPKK